MPDAAGPHSISDENDAAATHQLLNSLALRTRIIIAITFHKIDDTPDTQTGSNGHNEGL